MIVNRTAHELEPIQMSKLHFYALLDFSRDLCLLKLKILTKKFNLLPRMVETTRTLLDFKKYCGKIKKKNVQIVLHNIFHKYIGAAKSVSNFPLDDNIIKMELEALLSHLEKYQKVSYITSLIKASMITFRWYYRLLSLSAIQSASCYPLFVVYS